MINKLFLLVLACAHIYCLPLDKQEVDIETEENDPVITKMYAKEIEEGDNAEEPLGDEKKHHKANKKHLHGTLIGPLHHGHGGHHVPIGLPIDEGLHGYGHDMHHIGYGAPHIGHMGHHGHVTHRLPGHGSPLPIIFPHEHRHPHHHHSHHHAAHFGYPEYMPLPYAMPMCVIGKKLSGAFAIACVVISK